MCANLLVSSTSRTQFCCIIYFMHNVSVSASEGCNLRSKTSLETYMHTLCIMFQISSVSKLHFRIATLGILNLFRYKSTINSIFFMGSYYESISFTIWHSCVQLLELIPFFPSWNTVFCIGRSIIFPFTPPFYTYSLCLNINYKNRDVRRVLKADHKRAPD